MLTKLSLEALLDPKFVGRRRAERVLKLGGVVVSVLDQSGREDVRLHQPRCHNASLTVYEGTWTTLSLLVAMHHHDRSCVCVGKF